MKKGIFSSLILFISLFVTSVSNADEFSEKIFSKKYPHIKQSIMVYLHNSPALALGLSLEWGSDIDKDDISKDPKTRAKQITQCLSGIDTPKNLVATQYYISQNFSKNQLQQIEKYYASSAGQKDLSFRKKEYIQYDINQIINNHSSPSLPNFDKFVEQKGVDGRKMTQFMHSDLGEEYIHSILGNRVPEVHDAMVETEVCLKNLGKIWERQRYSDVDSSL